MQKKRLIILYSAAGAVALGTALLAKNMLSPEPPRKPAKQITRPVGTVEVLVASKPMGPGESLSPAVLEWRPWPKEAMLPGMIRRDRDGGAMQRIASARTLSPLAKGEPLMESKLIFPEDGGYLSAMLSPGMRAIAIPVNKVRTAGGYIKPYDRVDLLFVRKGSDLSKAEVVMENVKVLAINKEVVGKKNGNGKKGAKGPEPNKNASRAVLEMTLPQARVVTKLTRKGRIYLALRSLADKSPTGAPRMVGRFKDMVNGDDEDMLAGGIRVIARGMAKELGR
jgi:pilus assembly protein CpaB